MKSKNLNRMKRLFTVLIIVILLNVILLLLSAVLKQKNLPEPDRTDFSDNGNCFASAGEDASAGEGIFEGGNLAASDKDGISDKENEAASSPKDILGKESEAASSQKDIPDKENETSSSLEDILEDGNLTDSAENNISGKGNAENPSVGDIFGDRNPEGSLDTQVNPNPDIFLPETSEGTVTLCLMGDLMCLAGQQYTAERSDGSHDYTGSFYLLRDTFAACDFVIGNLETTLSESNPYSTKEREVNEQPNCNAPADYLASLKWAGITHLVTANNHSLDGGLIGVEETVAHLGEYGIPHTGTYRADYEGAHYLMLEKNGIRIALLSFTELINQRALVTPSQLARIIDSYSRADMEKRIAQARADGADFVIVYEHWGSENVHEVRAYQKSHAKEIAEAGADLIIGSHPHCLQEMETIMTQDGRSVPCFYSLGNVVSSMTRDINHDTVFVLVQLQQNAEEPFGQLPQQGKTETPDTLDTPESKKSGITSLSLLACHVLTSFDGHSRVIIPVDYPTEDEKAAAELAEAKERIEEIFPALD